MHYLDKDAAIYESFHEATSPSRLTDPDSSYGSTDGTNDEVEEMYSKAKDFLQMYKELETMPDTLKQQCSQLQELGKDLTENIEELKKQSEAALR